MEFQEAIRFLRQESGLSQRELGEKFKVNRGTIARWEAGNIYPKKQVADRLLLVVRTMNVSDQCKQNVKQALTEGRRQGKSAREYGIADIDLELVCKIVDESANAVYAIEADTHKILYANQQTEQLVQYDSKNIENKTCFEYVWGRKTPCPDCPLKEIRGYEFSEQIIVHKDQKTYLRIRGRKLKWNGKDIYITYVSNVTDLVLAHEARQRFLNLIPTGVGVFRLHMDGQIELVYMNDGFYRMFEQKKEDSILQPGFSWIEHIHSEDTEHLRNSIQKIFEEPRCKFEDKVRIELRDGIYHTVILHGTATEKTKEYYTVTCYFDRAN